MRTINFYIVLIFCVGQIASANQFGEDQLITESVCDEEIKRIGEENCGLAIREAFLTNLLIKYRDNEISAELFGSFASIYCMRMLGYTQCMHNTLPTNLNSICKLSYAYFAKMAEARLNYVSAEFYCDSNMKRLNNTLQDDGITCLYTQEFMNCKIQNITPNAIRSATENLCESLNANVICESFLGTCINPHVKLYQQQLSRLTRQAVGCPT